MAGATCSPFFLDLPFIGFTDRFGVCGAGRWRLSGVYSSGLLKSIAAARYSLIADLTSLASSLACFRRTASLDLRVGGCGGGSVNSAALEAEGAAPCAASQTAISASSLADWLRESCRVRFWHGSCPVRAWRSGSTNIGKVFKFTRLRRGSESLSTPARDTSPTIDVSSTTGGS